MKVRTVRGFTLVEMVTVLALVTVLAATSFLLFRAPIARAQGKESLVLQMSVARETEVLSYQGDLSLVEALTLALHDTPDSLGGGSWTVRPADAVDPVPLEAAWWYPADGIIRWRTASSSDGFVICQVVAGSPGAAWCARDTTP